MAKKSRSLARKDYGYNTRIVKGRRPRPGFWKSLNKPRELVRPNGIFNPHARIYGVLIIVLLMMGGLFLFDQSLKSPSTHGLLGGTSPLDPATIIWSDSFPTNLNGYSLDRSSYQSSAPCNVQFCVNQAPDANGPAIAISDVTIGDINLASNKNLLFSFTPHLAAYPATNTPFGWFLTINSTIPSGNPDASYSPYTDKNVALYSLFNYQGGGVYRNDIEISRNLGQTLQSQDTGGAVGSDYLAVSATGIGASADLTSVLYLNFTGPASASCNGSGVGVGCSVLNLATSFRASTQTQNTFQLTGNYYIGYFASKGLGQSVYWLGDNTATPGAYSNYIEIQQQFYTGASPTIDTSGFFGPVIKALISIGIFIVSSLFAFIGYVWTAAIQGFDIIGNFLGIGAIGTAFNSIIASVGGFIISVLTGLIQTFVNMTLATGQILTLFTTGFSNYFTALGGWMAALASLFGTVWTVLGGLLGYAKFSFMTLAVAWWCWGIYEAIFVGFPSWMTWANQTLSITMFFFRGIWWLTQTAWATILNVKSLIHPTAAGGGGSPPP